MDSEIAWDSEAVADLISRGVLSVGDGYRAKRAELAEEGLPFARAGNINNGFHFEGAEKLGWAGVEKAGHKVSRPGDVVFTSKGTVGRFAFVRPGTPKFVYSPQLCFWRSLNPDVLDPRYLFSWMNSREFFIQVAAVKGQTDMADYVSLRDQRKMRISVPPLDEQRRIAAVLGALDDKIQLNRKMNLTIDAMVQALFKSWLVEFDPAIDHALHEGNPVPPELEERAEQRRNVLARQDYKQPSHLQLFPAEFESTPAGPLPRGWALESLDQVATYLNGAACQKFRPAPGEDSLPVIKIREMNQGITVKTDRATHAIPEKWVVENGDVLFSWSGSLLVSIWTHGTGALNQHLFKVTSERFPRWFYYLWTKHHLAEFQRIAAAKATTMGHIKRRHLTDAKCVVPPMDAVDGLGNVFEPLVDLWVSNEVECRALEAARDALLPQLVTGELRVPDSAITEDVRA